jgi:hypothetical protein
MFRRGCQTDTMGAFQYFGNRELKGFAFKSGGYGGAVSD